MSLLDRRVRVEASSLWELEFRTTGRRPTLVIELNAPQQVDVYVSTPIDTKNLKLGDHLQIWSSTTEFHESLHLPDDGPWVFAIHNRSDGRLAVAVRLRLISAT